MNGILLCARHHKYDARLSAHKGSAMFGLWLQQNRPEQTAWVLQHWQDEGEPDYKRAVSQLAKGI